MLAIRLQRIGKKNRPSYRVVVSEKTKDMYGKHNEILGSYDPVSEPKKIELNAERIKYWLSVGAQPSDTVQNLLVNEKIIDAKKVRSWAPKKKEKTEEEPAAPKAEAPAEGDAPAEEAPAVEEKKEEAAE